MKRFIKIGPHVFTKSGTQTDRAGNFMYIYIYRYLLTYLQLPSFDSKMTAKYRVGHKCATKLCEIQICYYALGDNFSEC